MIRNEKKSIIYRVSPKVFSELKEPFGLLIKGTSAETMSKLKEIIEKEKPSKIISVGDVVSKNLHLYRIIPQLAITDNKSLRARLPAQVFPYKRLIKVKNPQGTITKQSIQAIQKALEQDKGVQISVDGEEDLLTLITVLNAPENALVIYGQPNEGIVVVKVSEEKKAKATRILEAMKI